MLEYLRLTPAFHHWNDNVPVSQQDDWKSYASWKARVDQLLCFIEKEGLILRKSAVRDDQKWRALLCSARAENWSASNIEYVVNHIHIADLFPNDPDADQIDDKVFFFLANTIADMWRGRLEALFPEKQFVVGVSSDEFDPEVYAHMKRDV